MSRQFATCHDKKHIQLKSVDVLPQVVEDSFRERMLPLSAQGQLIFNSAFWRLFSWFIVFYGAKPYRGGGACARGGAYTRGGAYKIPAAAGFKIYTPPLKNALWAKNGVRGGGGRI